MAIPKGWETTRLSSMAIYLAPWRAAMMGPRKGNIGRPGEQTEFRV